MSSDTKPLSPVRRFITTHDDKGAAIWDHTVPIQVQDNRSGGFTTHVPWVNEDSSNTLTDNNDLKSYRENPTEKDIAPASGSSLRVVDFWPGFPAIMHRTASVDYGIVMEGEIDCVLDNGAARTFRRGDIIIQRGTNHAWKNTETKSLESASPFCPRLLSRSKAKSSRCMALLILDDLQRNSLSEEDHTI